MAATPVKMCTKGDIFKKFLLYAPELCIKFCKYDIHYGYGSSINQPYEIQYFNGKLKDDDNVELTLFNELCPTYSEINKSVTLTVKISNGVIYEYTFDGKNLPLLECLSEYVMSDGSKLHYHSNSLVCLDSVIMKYSGNKIIVNFRNFTINVSDISKLAAGPEDGYYDEESGEFKHLVIQPVYASSTQLTYRINNSKETTVPGYFAFELKINDMLCSTFAHNSEYQITGRYRDLYYGMELDSHTYVERTDYEKRDAGGYVYLVQNGSQKLDIPIKINYVISDAVFDIVAIQFKRHYICFTTNMHIKVDARIIRLDSLQEPQSASITENDFTIKTIVRETTRSGKVQMPWGNRYYMIFDIEWDHSKYNFDKVFMKRKRLENGDFGAEIPYNYSSISDGTSDFCGNVDLFGGSSDGRGQIRVNNVEQYPQTIVYIYTKQVFVATSFNITTDINVTISVNEYNRDGISLGNANYSTPGTSYAINAHYEYEMHEGFDHFDIILTNIPHTGDSTGFNGFKYMVGSQAYVNVPATTANSYRIEIPKNQLPSTGKNGSLKIVGMKDRGIRIQVLCNNTETDGLRWTLDGSTTVQPWGEYYYKINTQMPSYSFNIDVHKPEGSLFSALTYELRQNNSEGTPVYSPWTTNEPFLITNTIYEGNSYILYITANVAFSAPKTLNVILMGAGNFNETDVVVRDGSAMEIQSVTNSTDRTSIMFNHTSESKIGFYLICEGSNNTTDNYKFSGCKITAGWQGIPNLSFEKTTQKINTGTDNHKAILVEILTSQLNEIYYSSRNTSFTLTMETIGMRKVRIVNNAYPGGYLVYSEIDFSTQNPALATGTYTNFHQVDEYLYTTDARTPENFRFRFTASTGNAADIDIPTNINRKYSDVKFEWYPNETKTNKMTIMKSLTEDNKYAYVEYDTDFASELQWDPNESVVAKLGVTGVINSIKIAFTSDAAKTISVTNQETGELYLNGTSNVWNKHSAYRISQEIQTGFNSWNYFKLSVGFPTSGWTEPAPPNTVRAWLYGYKTSTIEYGGTNEEMITWGFGDHVDLENPDQYVFNWNIELLSVIDKQAGPQTSDTEARYSAYRLHFEAFNMAASVHQIIGLTGLLPLTTNLTKNTINNKLVDGVKTTIGSGVTISRYYLIVRWLERGLPTPPDLNRFYINNVDPVAPDGTDMSQFYLWLDSATISELRDNNSATLKNISDIIKLDTMAPQEVTYEYEDGHTEKMYAIALKNTALFGNEYAVALAELNYGSRKYGVSHDLFQQDMYAFAFRGVKMSGLFTFKDAAGEVIATSDGTYTGEDDETTAHGICPEFGETLSFCFFDAMPHMIYNINTTFRKELNYTRQIIIAYHNDLKQLKSPFSSSDFVNIPSGLTVTNIDNTFTFSQYQNDGPQVNRRKYPAYNVTVKVTSPSNLNINKTYNSTVTRYGTNLILSMEILASAEYVMTSYLNVAYNREQSPRIAIMLFYCGPGYNSLYQTGKEYLPKSTNSEQYFQPLSYDTQGYSLEFNKIISSTTTYYKTTDMVYNWNNNSANFTRPTDKDVVFSSSGNNVYVVIATVQFNNNNIEFTKIGTAQVGEKQYWDNRGDSQSYLTDTPLYSNSDD